MIIGIARWRMTLQKQVPVADLGGGFDPGWTDVDLIWAALEPVSGGERRAGGRLESVISHRVRIRRRADVTTGHRLIHEGRAFNVRAVLDGAPGQAWLELLCEEGVAT